MLPPASNKKSYCTVHVSFQLTGSTDITTGNAIDEVELYVNEREKGRGGTQIIWAVERNKGRDLYLKV